MGLPHAALARAQQAAGGRDVRLGGGVATVRQYLRESLVDEMHLAMAPVLLGAGEALFAGIDLPGLGYQCTEHVSTPNATHVVLTNREARSPVSLRVGPVTRTRIVARRLEHTFGEGQGTAGEDRESRDDIESDGGHAGADGGTDLVSPPGLAP